jgi:hypothetical protein
VSSQRALRLVLDALAGGHLHDLQVALLQDLLDHIVLLLSVELGCQHGLGGAVVRSLSTLLVGDKDAEERDEVSQRNALIRLPLLVELDVVNEDEEVVVLTLEVDLGLAGLSSSHSGGVLCVVDRVCGGRSFLQSEECGVVVSRELV